MTEGKPENPPRTIYPAQLTLLQLMKLVAFAAVAALCLAPFVRMAEAGAVDWTLVLMGEAVGIPVVLACVALVLVRAGPGKDRLVRILLLLSLTAALGVAIHPLLGPSPIWSSGAVTKGFLMVVAAILSVPTLVLVKSLRAST